MMLLSTCSLQALRGYRLEQSREEGCTGEGVDRRVSGQHQLAGNPAPVVPANRLRRSDGRHDAVDELVPRGDADGVRPGAVVHLPALSE